MVIRTYLLLSLDDMITLAVFVLLDMLSNMIYISSHQSHTFIPFGEDFI